MSLMRFLAFSFNRSQAPVPSVLSRGGSPVSLPRYFEIL